MDSSDRAIAIVGVGAILPDAPNAPAFWNNILKGRYSITETPAERWSIADYYDPDPAAPDKTYSKIGGWVRGYEFDWKRFRVPPRVAAAMDAGQQWAVTIAAEALSDYGYPQRPLDTERTAVILGTAMGGELHYITCERIVFPEYAHALEGVGEFRDLPRDTRETILKRWREAMNAKIPAITEDSMPGELPNIVSGRVANVLNLRGPNFITDAACASSLAALGSAVELLAAHSVDAVLTGGVDRNMSISSFVKFCKIGALSATGTRPFGEGADGFVMGEGAAAFLLKRLEDAERAGDKIYAVVRGVGGASDGKGKGITAPNPIGQQLAVQRAWDNAGLDPATATLVEAHGTSTKVGDVVEVESLARVFGGAPRGRIALGSVKSNFGHLKAGAGAAGLLKATYAVCSGILPPTLNSERPNPDIDFQNSPFYLVHEAQEWKRTDGAPRRCGVSAYGFGGTNFHVVLEEHIPGRLTEEKVYAAASVPTEAQAARPAAKSAVPQAASGNLETPTAPAGDGSGVKVAPPRGILFIGAATPAELVSKFNAALERTQNGWTPPLAAPEPADLTAPERMVVDFVDRSELLDKLHKARRAFNADSPAAFRALQAQGIFRGSGPAPGRIAFLFPGQGSQYLNMGRELMALSPTVAQVIADADRVMIPILGRPLSEFILVDAADEAARKQAEKNLMQTAITQPAMLTLDVALYRLLADYGFQPDMVMGHSLGEYAALIVAGVMPFADALEAAAARGSEMTRFSVEDNGWMAAVMAPYDVVEATLKEIGGYIVAANINSYNQSVIGGASRSVEQAIAVFQGKGFEAVRLPVSHAFHTRIVAPASKPLRQVLNRLHVASPQIPLISNVTGEFYPTGVEAIKDALELQIASPVQWVKGLETLYDAGARTFVEVGPKKALKGFVDDVLGARPDVLSLFTNHPKTGELPSFNQALCGLYAAGYGAHAPAVHRPESSAPITVTTQRPEHIAATVEEKEMVEVKEMAEVKTTQGNGSDDASWTPNAGPGARGNSHPPHEKPKHEDASEPASLEAIALLLQKVIAGQAAPAAGRPYDRNEPPLGSIVISGTGLGLPGAEKAVMDPDNALRILRGEQFVDLVPERFRKKMLAKRITRVVKEADGSGRLETITDPNEVIKLAGRPGYFNLAEEYGVPEKLIEALDITYQLAMAAGLDALREAGIPLVQTFKRATTGKYLPDRWMLPEALRDETGVIFASAFPGTDRLADEFNRYYTYQNRLDQLALLQDLAARTTDAETRGEIDRRVIELRELLEREPYEFDRRFLFRTVAFGHTQFAEYIGARGPNTQVNAACSSTAQAVAIAEDWIRSGRCRRVVVIAADDVTSDTLFEWAASGFIATGAAATDDRVEDAALPFDRRRHGMILGMGACALVVESEDGVRERGMRGLVELLSSETLNSAFHGTRLDTNHIPMVMDSLLSAAERRFGLQRNVIAPQLVFMSHETYTPARGGSASAEIAALRHTFGQAANEIVITNTKGFTGHAMGAGVEDVIAVKILEYGIVPPVPNFKEPDPELGALNLSRGGRYPVQYALHLAAGFGSQIAMTFTRRIPGGLDRVDNPPLYTRWLADVSGYDRVETQVIKRVLRVKAQGTPTRPPAPSTWVRGTGPAVRARFAPDGVSGYGLAQAPDVPVGDVLRFPAPRAAVPPPTFVSEPTQLPVTEQAAPSQVQEPPKPVTPAAPAPIVPEPPHPAAPPVAAPVQFAPAASGDGHKQVEASPKPPAPEADVAGAEHLAKIIAEREVKAAGSDTVTEQVLQIVADKTGYPREMLDLDLDLEADLGIDTVKQAETFVAIREAFDIPRRENLKLRDYPTLARVIQFVRESSGTPVPPSSPPSGRGLTPAEREREKVLAAPAPVAAPSPVVEPAAAPEPPPASGAPAGGSDSIADKVLQIVADKTGYPREMLDLDLDLEADLGIDTVKQAETFAAIREAFSIPRVENLKLRDYPTLTHVIRFVREMSEPAPRSAPTRPFVGERAEARIEPADTSLEAADRIPRRVPTPVLRPALDLCKPTGVTLDAKSRVVVMCDAGGAGKQLVGRLRERGVTALAIEEPPASEALEAQVKAWLAEGPVQGVYWLPALDVEPNLEALDLEEWRELNRVRVKNLYTTLRALYESIAAPGAFLISAMRLGGLHGYGQEGASAPLGGAVTGFTKAYKRERGQALVKAVDLELDCGSTEAADLLIAETLYDPGVVEVGYWKGARYSVALTEQPARDGTPGLTLNRGTVFVVTGAAGSITSAIVADLAAASGGTFYLLDLVPPPDAHSPYVALFRADKEALKQKLIAEAQSAGTRPTPVMIEKKIAAIEREEAALRALETVRAIGGRAYYHSVNLLDGAAVTKVMDEIRERHGGIGVIVHAGGLEISRSLPDKDRAQFDLVFDVKADGFFNLLRAAKGMPIGATVVFSSVAGRFGNSGQTDYSAANDLMCKVTSSLRAWRPATRGIAIDWTAWGGIGMATRGSIPKIMEMAGIDTLPPECGVPTVRRELTAGGFRGEVVVAGRLGTLMDEWDETGGLDTARAARWLAARAPRLLMVGQVKAARLYRGIEVETVLDPNAQPFLHDHAMDGTPLLPGVMGTETFAELVRALAPGYTVAAVENEQFQHPFKFYRMQPQTLYLSATVHPIAGGELLAHAVLRSVLQPARPELPAQEKIAFTADVRLTHAPAEKPTRAFTPPAPEAMPITARDIYRIYFHGPAYQVLERAQVNGTQTIGLMAQGLPPNTDPSDAASLMAPRLIELCFQTAGIWLIKTRCELALPLAIRSAVVYRQAEEAKGKRLYAVVQALDGGARFDAEVIDESGAVYVTLTGYRTVTLPGNVTL